MAIGCLTLRRPFVADHFHDLPGFVEARHGHNWEIAATAELAEPGATMEEARFAALLDAWVAGVDYRLLNELPALQNRNPTAEVLAQWAFGYLRDSGLNPVSVRIREKANYWARARRAPEVRP